VTIRTALVVAILIVVATNASSQTPARQITGRITDDSGAGLPGVVVRTRGPGLPVAEATTTDSDGRFIVKGRLQPSPAAYTVTAQLAGFETATVLVRAHEGIDRGFTLRLHLECYEPDFEVMPDVRPLVAAADLIALVRLDSIERGQQPRIGDDWCGPITIFRARIIDPVKDRRPQRSPSVRFVLPGQEGQFERGDNYIAILQWHPATRAYRVTSRSYFALVRAGRLTEGDRKPIADVLSGLRSLSQP
jgi:hypothetical protein